MNFLRKFGIVEEESLINITNMIDVIFILLIFFMVSTQFKKASIEMELPQVEDTITVSEESTVANLAVNQNQIELEGELVSIDELEGKLSALLEKNRELAVSFSADRNISYERFLEIYVKIENAGITRIAIEHESLDN